MLAADLPLRWCRWQRAKNTSIYVAVRAVGGALRRLPLDRVPLLAPALGWLVWILSPAHRRRADENLRAALPELGASERRRLIRRNFVHLARNAFEVLRWDRGRGPSRVPEMSEEHRQLFADAVAEGKGVLLASGHIGNWELIPPVVARAGFPLFVVAKPTYDPRLTRWIHSLRSRGGVEVIWRGDSRAVRSLLGIFRKGAILGLLLDQDTDVHGVFVPFFGRPACTPSAAASLALRADATVLVCWMQRVGRRSVFHAERVEAPTEGTREERIVAITAAVTARLEQAIRERPEQWVWMHRRWKRKPRVQ